MEKISLEVWFLWLMASASMAVAHVPLNLYKVLFKFRKLPN